MQVNPPLSSRVKLAFLHAEKPASGHRGAGVSRPHPTGEGLCLPCVQAAEFPVLTSICTATWPQREMVMH